MNSVICIKIMQQARNIFFKDTFLEKRSDTKQFKTVTGSPILYSKIEKHGSIYYPLVKRNVTEKPKPQKSHKHSAVVNSRTYGREVYGNIDIWSDDDIARESMVEKLKRLSLFECNDAVTVKSQAVFTSNGEKGILRR